MAYSTLAISAAVFCTSQGIMFVASIISGILAYILSHNIGAAIGITFILIVHTMIHGE